MRHLCPLKALGGAALGVFTGYAAYLAMRGIDDYPIEVLISLGLVTGTYALAGFLHFSGPIAVVAAGVLTGNRGAAQAMSEMTRRYLFDFWSLIDEILNSVLFLLIGLEVLVISFDISLLPLAIAAIPIVLMARLVSVTLPMAFVRLKQHFVKGTIPVLTWGGVRGGISVALALSVPMVAERSQILAATLCGRALHPHRARLYLATPGAAFCRSSTGPDRLGRARAVQRRGGSAKTGQRH